MLLQKLFAINDVNIANGDPSLGSLYKRLIRIAWPAALEGALMSIIGSIDTMMVGRLGTKEIAAVGLTNQPRMILLILAQALCVGTTAVIARRKGEGDQQGAKQCFGQSMMIVTVLGIFMTLVGFFCAEPFMKLAGANQDTLLLSTQYFRIISLAMLFNAWSLCICAAMRAIGLTKITLLTNLVANLVNVVLNYLLIEGHFGFPALGVRGAAIATAIGLITGSVIAFVVAFRKKNYIRLSLKNVFAFHKDIIGRVSKIGSSFVLESLCLRVGFLLNSFLIARLSTDAFATFQIVSQVTMLTFTLGDGVAAAGAALVGQSLGEQRKDVAMAYARASRKVSTVFSVLIILLIIVFRQTFAMLFTSNAAVIREASIAFIVVAFAIYSQNGRVVYSGCLRGAGDVRFVAFISLISVAIIRPLCTFLFCYPLNGLLPGLHLSATGPWLAFLIDAVIRDSLLIHRINARHWLFIRV